MSDLRHDLFADPKESYRYPLTTSNEIAQWSRDEPLEDKEPWTKTCRHVIVTSEMTKLVVVEVVVR